MNQLGMLELHDRPEFVVLLGVPVLSAGLDDAPGSSVRGPSSENAADELRAIGVHVVPRYDVDDPK